MHLHFLSLTKGAFAFSSFGLPSRALDINLPTKMAVVAHPFELKLLWPENFFPIFSSDFQGEKGDANSRESTPKPKRKLKPLFEDEVKPEDSKLAWQIGWSWMKGWRWRGCKSVNFHPQQTGESIISIETDEKKTIAVKQRHCFGIKIESCLFLVAL